MFSYLRRLWEMFDKGMLSLHNFWSTVTVFCQPVLQVSPPLQVSTCQVVSLKFRQPHTQMASSFRFVFVAYGSPEFLLELRLFQVVVRPCKMVVIWSHKLLLCYVMLQSHWYTVNIICPICWRYFGKYIANDSNYSLCSFVNAIVQHTFLPVWMYMLCWWGVLSDNKWSLVWRGHCGC